MARVNLDGKVWKDPRVKRLAKRRTWSVRETIGTLAAVWDVAYDNRTPIMPRIDVDTAADTEGFAADMVAEDLATPIGDNLLDVRLRGVTERIDFLLTQAQRGRLGGLAKAAAKRTDGAFVADAKQTPSERQASAYHSGALPLDQDPDPDPDKDPDTDTDQDTGPRDLSPDALRLAGLLHDLIAAREPSGTTAKRSQKAREKTVARWATDIEKLHRIDGIDHSDIETVIRFSQASDFWAPSILCGKKVREKFETLLGQSKRKPAQSAACVGRVEPKAPSVYEKDAENEF